MSVATGTGWGTTRSAYNGDDYLMHPFQLPADVVARVTARRGRPFAFPTLDVKRTALVVIDMQNAFLAPGAAGEVPLARAIVPNINRIAAVLRRAGGTVAWVQVGITPGLPGGGWPVLYGEIFNPALADKYLAGLTPGRSRPTVRR